MMRPAFQRIVLTLLLANLALLGALFLRLNALERKIEDIDDGLFYVDNQTRHNQFLILDALERLDNKR